MGNTREVEIANRTLFIDEHDNVTDPLTTKEAAGCWTWDCSLVLSFYLTTPTWPAYSFNKKTVIELGAGTGIPGLTASLLGANVILTDLPPLLPGLQKNVEKNQLGDKVRVKELLWGDESFLSGLGLSQPADFVFMSDLLYDVNSVPALCKTLRQISDGHTQILLAYELRYGTTECFKALKEGGFRWVKVPQKDLDPQWQSEDIGLFQKAFITANTREVEIAYGTFLIQEHKNKTGNLTGKEEAGCWTRDCSLDPGHYLATPSQQFLHSMKNCHETMSMHRHSRPRYCPVGSQCCINLPLPTLVRPAKECRVELT